MDRRHLLQGLLGLAVVAVTPNVVSDGLELITSANAEEKKPKTVDDILAGTSFQNVCASDYAQKTRYGNVVVFFYDDSMGVDNESGRLARVVETINDEFNKTIAFLKYRYDCDLSLAHNKYQGLRERFNVTGLPQVNFYKNGKLVDTLNGGPLQGFNINVWVNDFRSGLRKLYK